MIQRALGIVLDTLEPIQDEVPEDIQKKHKLLSINDALEKIHRPTTKANASAAKKTLVYREAFLLQANLIQRRLDNELAPATPRFGKKSGYLERFDADLPFKLTAGQNQVGEQIEEDLANSYPMNRLLQGEVGSGKTTVSYTHLEPTRPY